VLINEDLVTVPIESCYQAIAMHLATDLATAQHAKTQVAATIALLKGALSNQDGFWPTN
jgi:hypothetical protein